MSDKPRLLIIEDDAGLSRQMEWALDDFETVVAANRQEAMTKLRLNDPDLITLDLGLPPDPDGTSEGFATLSEIKRLKPDTKVIVASGHAAEENGRRALDLGAWDFFAKPVDIDALTLILTRAAEIQRMKRHEDAAQAGVIQEALPGVLTQSDTMLSLAKKAARIAKTEINVLVEGPSGTGKNLIAEAIHKVSERADEPFVTLNCASLSQSLVDSELFGFEKGAFTGAHKTTPGLIERASGGTLYLDEIADLSVETQGKMLRFLEEKSIERLGGREAIKVDVRVIAATRRDAASMIAAGELREDLYHRLNEVHITLPPLSTRIGDAVMLARHLVSRFSAEFNSPAKGLTADAVTAIDGYDWPGNVRELENRVRQAVLMAENDQISAQDLELRCQERDGAFLNLKQARAETDQRVIRQAIAETNGNMAQVARLLGVSRPTLYDLLKQYGLR